MLLALDVSNTTIKAGVFEGERLRADWRFATERRKLADEYAMLLLSLFEAASIEPSRIGGVSISCVVPPLRSVFAQLARQYLNSDALLVDHTTKGCVALRVDNPVEVGADRIVNSTAIHRLYGGPAIGVVLGTATVFDCVSADGAYLGGAIAPGMVGALESLAHSAAQLYQVELKPPPHAIGTNTAHSMQSGLVLGYAALVEGLVVRLARELGGSEGGGKVKVIASGGLAEVIETETQVIDVVDQGLTLKGLRLIHEINRGSESQ